MQILIYKNNQQLGPFSPQQIQQMLASGQLNGNDLGWYNGLGEWTALNKIGFNAQTLQSPMQPPSGEIMRVQGKNGRVTLYNNKICISHSGFHALTQGLRGEKEILLRSITSIQFKPSGLTVGYIQFSFSGGSESKGGTMKAIKDENTVTFAGSKQESAFRQLKQAIEQLQMQQDSQNTQVKQQQLTYLDELEKLASLRERGVISEDEFNAKKKQLLG